MRAALILVVLLLGIWTSQSQVDDILPNVFTLNPFEIAKIKLPLSEINSTVKFIYGVDFTLTITSDDVNYDLPASLAAIQNNKVYLPEIHLKVFHYGTAPLIFTVEIIPVSTDFLTSYVRAVIDDIIIEIDYASRAILGTQYLFAIVIPQTIADNYLMPFNLYQEDDTIFVDLVINDPTLLNSSLEYIDGEPYDQSYWNDRNDVILPWFPFFAHCTNHGSRMIIYDLFELSPDCSLISESSTTVIKTIPTTGVRANADACRFTLDCMYLENVSTKYSGTSWFQISEEDEIVYITKRPQDPSTLSSKLDEFWNQIQQDSDNLIPVSFISNNPNAIDNGFPSKIRLKVSFLQKNKVEKNILKAEVVFLEYSTDTDNPSYELEVIYVALTWTDLLNNFSLNPVLYLILHGAISSVLVVGAIGIWVLNKFVWKRWNKIPPALQFVKILKLTIVPQFLGSLIGNLSSIAIVILVVWLLKSILNSFSSTFDPSTPSEDELLDIRRGRIGIAISICGIFFLYYGAVLLAPVPTEEEGELIEEDLQKQKQDMKRQDQFGDSDSDNDNSFQKKLTRKHTKQNSQIFSPEGRKITDEGEEEDSLDEHSDDSNASKEENKEQYGIRLDLQRKRHHFMLIGIFAGLTLNYILDTPSNSKLELSDTVLLIIVLLIDIAIAIIAKNVLLKESLLLVPITAAVEIIQFVIITHASNYSSFLWNFVIRMFIITAFRIYIEPMGKQIDIYLIKLVEHLNSRYQMKFLEDICMIRANANSQSERIKVMIGKNIKWNERTDLEYSIYILLTYTAKTCARFLVPWLLIMMTVFSNEVGLKDTFGLTPKEFRNYIFFWIIAIVPQFVMDPFIINSLEIIYDVRLYDYLSFVAFRYKNRTIRWIAKNNIYDRSISRIHRSADNLCFSTQFYFMICLPIWGILCITYGIIIMKLNSLPPFSDPAIIVITPILWIGIILSRFVLRRVSAIMDLWSLPKHPEKVTLKKVEDAYVKEIADIPTHKLIRSDLGRKIFLQENKEWLIKQLKFVLRYEDFHDKDGYLLKVYHKLADEEKLEEKQQQRQAYIDVQKSKNIKMIMKTEKYLEAVTNKELDSYIKDLRDNDQQLKIKKSAWKPTNYLLTYWLSFAKQNLYLKGLVKDIDQTHLGKYCEQCSIEADLRVITKIDLADLMIGYKIEYAGLQFDVRYWRRFYEKKQKFSTLCSDCEMLEFVRQRQNKKTQDLLNEATKRPSALVIPGIGTSKTTEKDNQEKLVQKLPLPLKHILYDWYMGTKSRMLHEEQKKKKNSKDPLLYQGTGATHESRNITHKTLADL